MARKPSNKSKSAKPFPTPYRACREGDCICGQIWSVPSDTPILTCEGGPWGDSWPALRTVDVSEGMSGTMLKVEAYTERLDYGSLDEDAAKATRKFVVRACNSHDKLVEALRDMVAAFTGRSLSERHIQLNALAKARAALADGDA